jgi:hypothetical protein
MAAREIPAGREIRPTVSGTEYRHAREKGWVRDWRPHTATRRLLGQVDEVLDEYEEFQPLTIRQIFYRLVGKYDYPKTKGSTAALYDALVNARRNDRLDWRKIRDDGVAYLPPRRRFVSERDFFDHVGAEADDWEIDPRIGQRTRIEVWCEAAGMTRQLARVADPYGIPIYSGGGFDSLTAVFETVERIARRDELARRGCDTVVLVIGDLDYSGRSIIDAFAADVWAFLSEYDLDGDGYRHDVSELLTVEHVAVTEDQIDEHDLETAPQKPKDKRAGHMARTVQAEALPPDVLADIVDERIRAHLNVPMLRAVQGRSGLEAARVADRFYRQRSAEWWADSGFTAGRENRQATR